jgi:hypothetical protein
MSTWNNSIGTAMLDKVEISIGHAKHEAMVCSSCNKESKYGTPKEIPKGFICKQQIRLLTKLTSNLWTNILYVGLL